MVNRHRMARPGRGASLSVIARRLAGQRRKQPKLTGIIDLDLDPRLRKVLAAAARQAP